MNPFTGMSVVKPHAITDAVLTSSTVLDVAPAVYVPGTTYALGALCSVAGALGLITAYKSLQAGNTGHTPASSPAWWEVVNTMYQPYSAAATYALGERVQDNSAHLVYESLVAGNVGVALSDATKWAKVGATARWAAFDSVIGTACSGASPLTVVLQPQLSTTGLMLLEMSARTAQVVVRAAPGGSVVYNKTLDLDGTLIDDVYDWFFADFEPLRDVVLTDLPGQYPSAEITVELTTTSGPASIGVLKPGAVTTIGATKMGARVGILDFSKKERDRFGGLELREGEYAKKASFAIMTDKARFNKIFRTLASLRATLCVYIGTGAAGYEPLLVYGYFEDFSIDVEYHTQHLCSLTVIGAI